MESDRVSEPLELELQALGVSIYGWMLGIEPTSSAKAAKTIESFMIAILGCQLGYIWNKL